MVNEKLKEKLTEIKKNAEELLKIDYVRGKDRMAYILSNLQMIIRRVYPDYEKVEIKLIGDGFFHWDTDDIDLHVCQKWFIEDVKVFIRAIDIILSEDDIFGIKDFTPLKEETEFQLGSERLGGFFRRKKSK